MTKTAIIYFSRADENWVQGRMQYLTQGLTESLVEQVAQHIPVDLYPIKRQPAYDKTYAGAAKEARTDLTQLDSVSYRVPDFQVQDYDQLILAYPIFWHSLPAPLQAFLKDHDLIDKQLHLLATHEGDEMGKSLEDLQNLCPRAIIKSTLAIPGSAVHDSQTELTNWLVDIKKQG